MGMPNSKDDWKSTAGGMGCLFLLFVVGWLAYGAYGLLDESGWIQHSHDTPVWIEGEWLTSEYRGCKMPGRAWGELPTYAHLLCGKGLQNIDDAWPAPFRNGLSPEEYVGVFSKGHWDTAEHYFHVLPVRYWGKINRLDRDTFSWSCQKQESGLVCYAVN